MMAETALIRARFEDFGSFEHALHALSHSSFTDYEAYGPVNLAEIEYLMPRKGSAVRGCATMGAVVGLVTLFLVSVLSSRIYDLVVGGKPPVTALPFIIPAYEGTILMGAIAAFVAVIALSRLEGRNPPPAYDRRFGQDSFGITVNCNAAEVDQAIELLERAGAAEVEKVE